MVEADDVAAAAEQLKLEGGYILELKERFSLSWLTSSRWLEQLFDPLAERTLKSEKVLFTSQLGEMLRTGLPIIKALEVFIDEKQGRGASPLKKIMAQLEMGKSLSQALSIYPRVFDTVYISIVRSGEAMGKLAETLIYLGRQLKREQALRTKVRSALIYPAVVLISMAAVMIFITLSVVPKIVTFAQNSGAPLPLATQAIIAVTMWLSRYWLAVTIGAVLGLIGLWRAVQTEMGKKAVDQLILRLPLIGQMVRRYNQVRFTRLLSGFYRYGISVEASFDILSDCLGNAGYSSACRRIKQRLIRGENLSNSLALEQALFSGIIVRVVKGGEQTGVLDQTLLKLAIYYERELNDKLNNLTAIIEPILILLLGVGVLGIALAVIVPIYKVTSQLR